MGEPYAIQAPNANQIMQLAGEFGMNLSPDDAQSFVHLMAGLKAS
jgi:hypothetical protein